MIVLILFLILRASNEFCSSVLKINACYCNNFSNCDCEFQAHLIQYHLLDRIKLILEVLFSRMLIVF